MLDGKAFLEKFLHSFWQISSGAVWSQQEMFTEGWLNLTEAFHFVWPALWIH